MARSQINIRNREISSGVGRQRTGVIDGEAPHGTGNQQVDDFITVNSLQDASVKRKYGIYPKALDAWSIALSRGIIPTVDKEGKVHSFPTMDVFIAYVLDIMSDSLKKKGMRE